MDGLCRAPKKLSWATDYSDAVSYIEGLYCAKHQISLNGYSQNASHAGPAPYGKSPAPSGTVLRTRGITPARRFGLGEPRPFANPQTPRRLNVAVHLCGGSARGLARAFAAVHRVAIEGLWSIELRYLFARKWDKIALISYQSSGSKFRLNRPDTRELIGISLGIRKLPHVLSCPGVSAPTKPVDGSHGGPERSRDCTNG
jgi:hypothetical protein